MFYYSITLSYYSAICQNVYVSITKFNVFPLSGSGRFISIITKSGGAICLNNPGQKKACLIDACHVIISAPMIMRKGKEETTVIARNIRLLILDVDGVLTDGGIILDNEGNELKSFHVRDGHGVKMLIRHGVDVAIITGRHSKVVERRAHELGVREVYQRCIDKVTAYEEIKQKFSLNDSEIAYIGDDIVDIQIMRRVGLSVAVADAAPDARGIALIVTENPGGRGAVREITDLILKAKGLWQGIIDDYFKA